MHKHFVFIYIVGLVLLLSGCFGSPSGPDATQAVPSNPSPRESGDVTGTLTVLAWSYPHDSLITLTGFDVYFGAGSSLERIREGVTDTFCIVGPLEPGVEYSWRVTAVKTDGSSKTGPVWSFQTGDEYIFPLMIGQEWTYRHEMEYDNFVPDSLRHDFPTIVTGTATMEIMRQIWTNVHSNPMVEFEIIDEFPEFTQPSTCTMYIGNTDDGLYLYWFDGSNYLSPTKPQAGGEMIFRFNGRDYASLAELTGQSFGGSGLAPSDFLWADERIAGEAPHRGLAYPLEVGNNWTYATFPFRVDKRVVGRDQVTVEAGSFDCYVVQTMWDMNNDGQWDENIERLDYYGSAGLVKREYYYYGITVTDETGWVLGVMDIHESYVLTRYTLP